MGFLLHAVPLDCPTTSSVYYSKVGAYFKDKRRLMDLFCKGIRYTPSCRVLLITQSKSKGQDVHINSGSMKPVDEVKHRSRSSSVYNHGLQFVNLVGINNPDGSLSYTELDCIQKLWKAPSFVFIGDEARLRLFAKNEAESETKVKVAQAQLRGMWNECECLHFTCHGKFNISRPMQSALYLARNEKLLLRDIFSLHLPKCKLVTLSACETGLIDIHNKSDEYVGLPSAFLFAGATHTVGSLWSVYDTSTTVLMVKFYEILKHNKNISIPEALWQSQQWYRTLDVKTRKQTYNELVGESNAKKLTTREFIISSSFLPAVPEAKRKRFLNVSLHPRHPVHWAAFICVG